MFRLVAAGCPCFGGRGGLNARPPALRTGLATGVPLSVGAGIEWGRLSSSHLAPNGPEGDVDSESLSTFGKSPAVAMRSGVIGFPHARWKALNQAGDMTLGCAHGGVPFSEATLNQIFGTRASRAVDARPLRR